MLPVSLDYPFSIAASVFSNVYFLCSFFYFTSCGTRFSFDVTEMVLLFVTIRKASSTPWLLIVQGIFKNMFRTKKDEQHGHPVGTRKGKQLFINIKSKSIKVLSVIEEGKKSTSVKAIFLKKLCFNIML
jgi:hypothetical protein